jgi:hypothetical protein
MHRVERRRVLLETKRNKQTNKQTNTQTAQERLAKAQPYHGKQKQKIR